MVLSHVRSLIHQAVAEELVRSAHRTAKEPDTLLPFLDGLREIGRAWNGQEIALKTASEDTINAFYIPGNSANAILFLHGNGCFYENSFSHSINWWEMGQNEREKPHLLVFNPRGTGKSRGVLHPDTVAEDFLIAFRYLVEEKGVDPNRVAIIGHSMGGFFAALGAALIQKQYPQATIHLISDRSFSTITSRVHREWKEVRYAQTARAVATLALISWTGWKKDPIDALLSLRGRVCVLYHRQDEVIPYSTSLHAAIPPEVITRRICAIELGLSGQQISGAHNYCTLSKEEEERVRTELRAMLYHS